MTTWTAIRFLHLAGIVFFVGGQLVLAAAVAPALRQAGNDATMRAIAIRFGIGSAIALVVIVATGIAMASHYHLWEDDTLHAKLAVLVLIGVLTALHIVSARTRAISIALLFASLLTLWLGVKLTYG